MPRILTSDKGRLPGEALTEERRSAQVGSPRTWYWCGLATAAAVPAGAAAEAAVDTAAGRRLLRSLHPAATFARKESRKRPRRARGGLLGGERMPAERSKAAYKRRSAAWSAEEGRRLFVNIINAVVRAAYEF